MSHFLSYILKKKFPSFSILQKELQRPTVLSVLFYIFLMTLLVVVYIFLWQTSKSQSIVIPVRGGTLIEGVIGAPRFINPLLATSGTDTHLVSLIYSGLTKRDSDGAIVSDLATYTRSDDQKTYTFTLKENVRFSNGTPLTTDDILFTYGLVQQGYGGISLQNAWHGVTFQKISDHELSITSPGPSEQFLLLTTIGILPKTYWEPVMAENFQDTDHNMNPIGSGPFHLKRLTYKNGITETVVLNRNQQAVTKPYLSTYKIVIFPNQETIINALESRRIDLTTTLPTDTLIDHSFSRYSITSIPTSETLVIAAQASGTILSDERIRGFINTIIDKTALLATIEGGYGLLEDQNNSLEGTDPILSAQEALLSQKDFSISPTGTLLKQGDVVRLLFIVESNSKESLAANFIAAKLRDAGIETEVRSFDTGTFRDLVSHGSAPVILTTKNRAPDTYNIELPLYTRTAPIIINKKMEDFLSQSGTPSITNLYTTTADWYIRSERRYHWFN